MTDYAGVAKYLKEKDSHIQCCGYLSDVLGKRDDRWYAWIPALSMFVSTPFSFVALMSGSVNGLLLFLIPVSLAQYIYAPPVFATVQRLAGLQSRAMASAIMLFIANLIGLGLGSLLLGMASDLLQVRFGDEDLRYSLLFATSIAVWASLHYLLASRYLRNDLLRK